MQLGQAVAAEGVKKKQVAHAFTEAEVKKIVNEVLDEQADKQKVLDQFWHEIPPNTYGTAIWAILVMDIDALIPSNLWLPPESPNVQRFQRWHKKEGHFFLEIWARLKYRILPYINVALFNLVVIFLCGATISVQVGFAFLLNDALELNPSFKDSEGTEFICGTTGYIQFTSIGFFMAYMLGQMPRIIKTWILIWASEFETTVDRGIDGKTKLFVAYGDKDAQPEPLTLRRQGEDKSWFQFNPETAAGKYQWSKWASKYRQRTSEAMMIRRFFAWIFAAADMTVTGYVLYCGVRYIFWSGYVSLDPVFAEEAKFGPTEEGGFPDGGFPWMSNTKGIEEVLMATLALVFIMDIDELLFQFLLPRCVQNVVTDTRLSCVKWMPAKFDFEEFKNLGQPLRHQKSKREDAKKKEEAEKARKKEAAAQQTSTRDIIARIPSAEKGHVDGDPLHFVDDKFAWMIHIDDHEDEREYIALDGDLHQIEDYLTDFQKSYKTVMDQSEEAKGWDQENDYDDLYKKEVPYYLNKCSHESAIVAASGGPHESLDDRTEHARLLLKKLQLCREQRFIDEKFDDFRLGWMAIVPMATFMWVAVIISLSASVVIMVRHGQGCGTFENHYDELPNMPEKSSLEDWEAQFLAFGPPAVLLFIAVFYAITYVKDIVWDEYKDGQIFRMMSRRAKAEHQEMDIEAELRKFAPPPPPPQQRQQPMANVSHREAPPTHSVSSLHQSMSVNSATAAFSHMQGQQTAPYGNGMVPSVGGMGAMGGPMMGGGPMGTGAYQPGNFNSIPGQHMQWG